MAGGSTAGLKRARWDLDHNASANTDIMIQISEIDHVHDFWIGSIIVI